MMLVALQVTDHTCAISPVFKVDKRSRFQHCDPAGTILLGVIHLKYHLKPMTYDTHRAICEISELTGVGL
jgi:hypothetical protein